MATTTNLDTLKINYLTQAQYDSALENNEIDEDQLYLTPESNDMSINDLVVAGNAAIAGALTVGGAEVKPTVYRDFRSPSFTTTTGAVGSYMMLLDFDVALSGYVPVSATLTAWAHVSYLPFITIQNNSTIRVILVRNGSGAATYPAGDFTVRVHYLKS